MNKYLLSPRREPTTDPSNTLKSTLANQWVTYRNVSKRSLQTHGPLLHLSHGSLRCKHQDQTSDTQLSHKTTQHGVGVGGLGRGGGRTGGSLGLPVLGKLVNFRLLCERKRETFGD